MADFNSAGRHIGRMERGWVKAQLLQMQLDALETRLACIQERESCPERDKDITAMKTKIKVLKKKIQEHLNTE